MGRGIFLGEGVRPHRSSGKKGGVYPLVLSYQICYYMLDLDAGGGEVFRVWSLSEEDVRGSLFVSSELLNMLLHVRPGRWWRGNFSGGWSLSEEDVRGSLFVSSELLNMLLHVNPGRWLRGNFSGEGVRPGRSSG